MKKRLIILTTIGLILFTGCSTSGNTSTNNSVPETTTESESTLTTESTSESESYVEAKTTELLETDTVTATINSNIDINLIPEIELLHEELATVLASIGVLEIKDMNYIDLRDNSGIINLFITITTDLKKIDANCTYIDFEGTPIWSVTSITDTISDDHYYIYEGLDAKVDLYDYLTGQLKSEKTEEFGNPVDDFNKQAESIRSDFEDALDEIANEYNLEK